MAYPQLDQAAASLSKLQRECDHFDSLAAVFELAGLITPIKSAISETWDDLTCIKDVWDTNVLCKVQFDAWKSTLWSDIRTDVMEEGAKNFVKEIKSLNKKVNGWGRALQAVSPELCVLYCLDHVRHNCLA